MLQVTVAATFDLRVAVDGNKNDIYIDTDPGTRSQKHDLTLGLDVNFQGLQAMAYLGPLNINVNDGPLHAPWTTSENPPSGEPRWSDMSPNRQQ